MSSVLGALFRVSTFGESHGPGVGVVIDGCPPKTVIDPNKIQAELDRRKPGQSRIVTQRKEADEFEILSGVEGGLSTGAPIAFLVRNTDQRSRDYEELKRKFRPSHADFTYQAKFGIRTVEGGGRSSARETVSRVIAGAVAKSFLSRWNIEILAFVEKIHKIQALIDPLAINLEQVEASIVRCPDPEAAALMEEAILTARKEGDSVGGVIACVVKNVPVGLGEPVFDRLEADLAKAMLSIPATKGFEIGSGFSGAAMKGSENNDEMYTDDFGQVRTYTNSSGGVQGGISNGMPIYFKTAFKPTATIVKEQKTVDVDWNETTLASRGRHDPCVVPRAVPIVEAMTAVVLADHVLRQIALNLNPELRPFK